LPQAEPYQPYPAISVTQTDPFSIEVLSPAEMQSEKLNPITEVQPARALSQTIPPPNHRDVLQELYNAMQEHEHVNIAPHKQDTPAAREVSSGSKQPGKDVLPIGFPKPVNKKYVTYSYTDNEHEEDEG
jgi:hypothetical protein